MTTETPPIRVALLSDERLFREGLLRLLRDEPSVSLVTQEPSAHFTDRIRQASPQVLLVDSRMPTAFSLCTALRREGGPWVIFVAAPDDDAWAREALSAGARGLLTKAAGAGELVKAIEIVGGGLLWAPRRVMVACIDLIATGSVPRRRSEALVEAHLSARERDVLRHAATGVGNKELAALLSISEATVKVHLSSIFRKLGVRSRGELAAAYHGFLSPGAGDPHKASRRSA